jgi:hypothetical protein
MSSHVGPVIIGSHQQEEERVPEELWGQHTSSVADPNLSLEQGKPGACRSYLKYRRVLLYLSRNVDVLCTYI